MGRARIGVGILLLCAGAAQAAAPVAGPATVTDGDTLVIGTINVRLFGVDAPERSQTCQTASGADWACGAMARALTTDLVAGRDISCDPVDQDRYGRIVARCTAGGADLGERLVGAGLAWAYVQFSSAYVGTEAKARAARRGIWQGAAETAWDYRANGGFVPASGAPGPADPACRIKGNVNPKGEHIYHQPQDRDYAKVRVTAARGERWFCTATEAEAAGWRAVGAH